MIEQICKDSFSNCQLSFIVCLLLIGLSFWIIWLMRRINILENQNKFYDNQYQIFKQQLKELREK